MNNINSITNDTQEFSYTQPPIYYSPSYTYQSQPQPQPQPQPQSQVLINVYDDYNIELGRYPRINTDKETTDKIIITCLMHQDKLEKMSIAYQESIRYHNECKEYYFTFRSMSNNTIKKYSASDVMGLITMINDFFSGEKNIKKQLSYIKRCNPIDIVFYFYLKNKDFFINLFTTIEEAKNSYLSGRDLMYKISPPVDLYGKSISKMKNVYNAQELLEINAYAQFLIRNNIVKNMPNPVYLE